MHKIKTERVLEGELVNLEESEGLEDSSERVKGKRSMKLFQDI